MYEDVLFPGLAGRTQLAGSLARHFALASVIHSQWIRCKTGFRFPAASPSACAGGVWIPHGI